MLNHANGCACTVAMNIQETLRLLPSNNWTQDFDVHPATIHPVCLTPGSHRMGLANIYRQSLRARIEG